MGEFHKLADNEDGTTAVEFAIVSPIFIALVIGIMSLCLCLFLLGSLHIAVEEGARCASVRTTDAKTRPQALLMRKAIIMVRVRRRSLMLRQLAATP